MQPSMNWASGASALSGNLSRTTRKSASARRICCDHASKSCGRRKTPHIEGRWDFSRRRASAASNSATLRVRDSADERRGGLTPARSGAVAQEARRAAAAKKMEILIDDRCIFRLLLFECRGEVRRAPEAGSIPRCAPAQRKNELVPGGGN